MEPTTTGIDAIARHAAALADLTASADLTIGVPSCPGWRLADLVHHVGEVHDFWAHVISTRPAPPADYDEPERPADDELVAWLRGRTAALLDALDGADPADAAWSWADEQTVAFTLRRQTHEVIVHRGDAALAVGATFEVDDDLASDGIDELVDVFLTAPESWAQFVPGGVTVDLVAGDGRWALELGRAIGTPPRHDEPIDVPALRRRAMPASAAVHADVSGSLEALLWFGWGRAGVDSVEVTGDPAAVDGFLAVIADALT